MISQNEGGLSRREEVLGRVRSTGRKILFADSKAIRKIQWRECIDINQITVATDTPSITSHIICRFEIVATDDFISSLLTAHGQQCRQTREITVLQLGKYSTVRVTYTVPSTCNVQINIVSVKFAPNTP
jgi:hypothetical protein